MNDYSLVRSHSRGISQVGLAAVLLAMIGVADRNASGATIYVNTTTQKISGPGTGGCSLQEAIYTSNPHFSMDGVHGVAIVQTDPDVFITTDCNAGTGNDTIVLPANGIFQFSTITDGDAYNYSGLTATPLIISTITIQGNGATLQWTGTGSSRLFAIGADPAGGVQTPHGPVSGVGFLNLLHVYIKGFHIKRGDGSRDGGGLPSASNGPAGGGGGGARGIGGNGGGPLACQTGSGWAADRAGSTP